MCSSLAIVHTSNTVYRQICPQNKRSLSTLIVPATKRSVDRLVLQLFVTKLCNLTNFNTSKYRRVVMTSSGEASPCSANISAFEYRKNVQSISKEMNADNDLKFTYSMTKFSGWRNPFSRLQSLVAFCIHSV